MEQLSDSPKIDDPDAPEHLDIESNDSPEKVRERLNRMFSGFEKQFRRERPLLWKVTLLAPLVLSLVILGVTSLIYGPGSALKLINHALLTFFVLGRFVLLAGVEGEAAEKVSKIAMYARRFSFATFWQWSIRRGHFLQRTMRRESRSLSSDLGLRVIADVAVSLHVFGFDLLIAPVDQNGKQQQ